MYYKCILFVLLCLCTQNSFAQLKVANNGKVMIGTSTPLGASLYKTSILSDFSYRCLYLKNQQNFAWGQSMTTEVLDPLTANYVLNFNRADRFYVVGAGWIYCNGSYISSDSSLKERVRPIQNPLQKVLALNGVRYQFKRPADELIDSTTLEPNGHGGFQEKYQIGFLAQQVEAIVPEVVKTLPQGKAIAYQNLVALLVEAIKEQQTDIDRLKREVFGNNNGNGHGNNHRSTKPNPETDGTALAELLQKASLSQNKPNPFHEKTEIAYSLPAGIKEAKLFIYNMQGTQLKAFDVPVTEQGNWTVSGGELSAGIYFYSLLADGVEVGTKKMILTAQ